jgi:hypothetical protein
VLEDDAVTMRKDIDHLERVIDRLNIDLARAKSQLEESTTTIKKLTIKNTAQEK